MEGRIMDFRYKGGLAIAVMAVMIVAMIIMVIPDKVQATPINVLEDQQLLGGSVVLNVFADPVSYSDDSDWMFTYKFETPYDDSLYSISVGSINLLAKEKVTVWDNTFPEGATPGSSKLGPTSLVVYFLPSGLEKDTAEFYIIYDKFIDSQAITVAAIGNSLNTATIRPTYTYNGTIPEPASILLLGCGLITLGLLSRRRRNS
jgi:hypothetical protein